MDAETAFVEIIQQNEALVYKVTKMFANGKEDGQDLYQEIVYQLWKSFGTFRHESKITTWMYRIALNTAVTFSHKEKRHKNRVPVDETLLNTPAINDALKEERTTLLYTQLRRLDTIEKGIILLYLDGKTYEEIAAITGFSATNVGTRLGRIKQKIKSQINK
jgi:RNA polymerase sigma-70 factor (ECF subfamily)